MTTVFELARRWGVAIEFADLGLWGADELRSEYDPHGPAIRINARLAEALPPGERDGFVAFAVAHELYHHRERLGEVARIRSRAEREAAADAYAREVLAAT